jgi:hypothetical protein
LEILICWDSVNISPLGSKNKNLSLKICTPNISKHWNQLKGDVVEALQCLKRPLWNDLMFRQPEVEDVSDNDSGSDSDLDDEQGWDNFISEDDEDDGFDADNEREQLQYLIYLDFCSPLCATQKKYLKPWPRPSQARPTHH